MATMPRNVDCVRCFAPVTAPGQFVYRHGPAEGQILTCGPYCHPCEQAVLKEDAWARSAAPARPAVVDLKARRAAGEENQALVRSIEEVLEQARRGEVEHLVLIAFDPQQGAHTIRHKAANFAMLGALRAFAHRLEHEVLEGAFEIGPPPKDPAA